MHPITFASPGSPVRADAIHRQDITIAAPPRSAPSVDVDPYSDAFIADPYAQHAQLRDAAPVVWIPRYRVYACARHAEVRAVLRDHETYISSAGVGLANFNHEPPLRPKSLLLEADPPAHGVARAAVARVLSPQAVGRLREGFAAVADALVERLVAKRTIDAVGELAQAYALKVFPDAVGLQVDEREPLLRYSDLLFNAFGPCNALFERSAEGFAAASEWVMAQCQRSALRPGGFGAQLYAAADAGEIGLADAPLLVRSFLSAGLDTAIAGIGHALLCLAQHPNQYQRLRADPELARPAFEEALRLEAPGQLFCRTTSRDTELAGVAIPADSKVVCFLGAANRDPRQWADPDRFDIARRPAGHLAFGIGIHACVGQMIARMEGELVLRALAQRVCRIELDGVPLRRPNNTLRTLASLPLRLIAEGVNA
jgi:4-methoxybenzoate monooxygenase (O-demethylating)